MIDLTLERIRLFVDYEVGYGYGSEAARIDAIRCAEEGAITLQGSGPNGTYTAQRLGPSALARDLDTGEILAAIHARADSLQGEDRAQFGRAVLYAGAAIVGHAEGPGELEAMLLSMALTATDALDEGRKHG